MTNTNVNSKEIKILTWNCQGIKYKTNELEILVNELDIDIVMIQETKINKQNPPSINNYQSINKSNGNHHGLLTYIKRGINFTEIDKNFNECENQIFIIDNYAIINFYISPNSKLETETLKTLLDTKNKVIIVGDFNARHTEWKNYTNNANGKILKNFISNSHGLLYHPQNNFTHFPDNNNRPSTIDLAIAKNITISEIETKGDLNSDHLPVLITTNLKNAMPNTKIVTITNWDKFRTDINNITIINRNMPDKNEINKEIKKLTSNIISCMDNASKTKKIDPSKIKISDEIKEIIKTKNRLRRQFHRLRDPAIKTEINYLQQIINVSVNSIKSDKWENTLRKIQPNKPGNLWKIAKCLKNKKTSYNVPAIQSKYGLAITDSEKANAIADNLHDIHRQTENLSDRKTNIAVERLYQNFHKQTIETPETALTTPKEIKQVIKNLSNNKAPGEDKITNKLLKNLPRKPFMQLYYIINSCLKIQYFPNVWKNAIIIPFQKPNKNPNHPSSYRPISLLPTMGKILEKIIQNQIVQFEKENKILIPEQFGFRQNHSTIHQLARITDKITINYNINKITSLLTLDIEKAFDTVWHNALIYKLIKNKFPNHIIKMIHSFLKNRSFQVRINKTLSNKHQIPAGVPQGAILSPTLFLYYINDIPKGENTEIALFADDTAIVTQSTQLRQTNVYLQRHINKLENYFEKWKIKINTDKTTLTHFTHKKINQNTDTVTFYQNQINAVSHTKYLGVTLDRKLKHLKQITEATRKAKVAMNTISPLLRFNSPLPQKMRINLYKMYVRPILLYGCQIYSNASNSNINKLQVVQNKSLRLILGKKLETPIRELHKIANIPMIKDKIQEFTNKFYYHTIKQNATMKNVARFNSENAPFKVKHKLAHHITYN